MNTAYRVWDGERMYYWDDLGLSLELKGDKWILWHSWSDGSRAIVVESDDKDAALMWGTGVKDETGKMIYPGNEIEFYVEGFSITSKMVRLTKTIEISGGLHNVPGDYGENIRIIGDVYEKKEGAE
ncbi:YopX family protein [Bacillus inaquosorum]|uniref:YopX family protein n=1 Tax=Bacillus inaquosorum TaxID=483913 RepID=UPI0022826DF9|nr:YopX family protein [Bacillus inaquosorum]MCY9057935.1 YopX family protein [Bacillus inaquosorum]